MKRLRNTALICLAFLIPGTVSAQALKVKGYCYTEKVVDDHLNVFGEITNPWTYPVKAEGKVVVRDAAGWVVQSDITMTGAVVNPGETLPVYGTGRLAGRMSSCTLEYLAERTATGLRGRVQNLKVQYEELVVPSARVTLQVVNTTGREVTGGQVYVTGYDAKGRVVMMGTYSLLERLSVGGQVPVAFTAMNVVAKPATFRAVVELVGR